MFLRQVSEQGVGPALEKMLAFQESRLRMIAENIANAQTPGYRTKQLDVAAFQSSLREALEQRNVQPGSRFALRESNEMRDDSQGFLRVTPTEQPVQYVLFHDGTNVSIEKQMADLAQTGLWSELATKLLQSKFDRLRTSIRGTV